MSIIDDLIARVRTARGPDRTIDEEIVRRLGYWHSITGVPRTTGSLDAAMGFVHMKLPEYDAHVAVHVSGRCWAAVRYAPRSGQVLGELYEEIAPTAPLALTLVTLVVLKGLYEVSREPPTNPA